MIRWLLLGLVLTGAEARAAQELGGLAPPAGEVRPTVTAVELHLPQGMDPNGIADAITVSRGQPLSPAAVRRSIERLYFTRRFRDVVVRTVPEKGGVRVIFDLSPRLTISEVHVDGERALTEEAILAAARLPAQGEEAQEDRRARPEYFPEFLVQVQERAEALYFRRGYRQAQVEAEAREGEDGVMVLLTVDEGFPTRVEGVTLGGNPGLGVEEVTKVLGISTGEVLDLDLLERGLDRLKALYREERFYRARLGDPEVLEGRSGTGVILALPVHAGPRYDFHVHGNRRFPDKLLLGVLGYDGEEALDRVVMNRMSRRLRRFYRYYGYHDARVTPEEVRAPDNARAVVAFHVTEGHRLYVREVSVEGNQALADAVLRRIIREQISALTPLPGADVPAQDDPLAVEGRTRGGARPIVTLPDPLTVFVPQAYEEAARTIRDTYRERGYLSAKVEVPKVEIDVGGQTARVTVRVEEGPQALVRQVKYLGLPNGFDPRGAGALRLGEPFRSSGLEETGRALARGLGREGYLFARVSPERTTISPDGKDAFVVFQVEAGPQVRVGQVVVSGLGRTDEDLVRANLVVKEGAVLDPEDLFESQRNLVLLGIFRTVAVRLNNPDKPEELKDVWVELRERPRLSGELAGGYSLVDGPRVVGDATYPNLLGSATSLTGRLKVNYVAASALVVSGDIDPPVDVLDGIDFRGNLALTQPRIYTLLPARVGTRLDLIGERVHRPGFTFLRYAAVAGLDWAALDWMTLSLQYEIEHDRVRLTRTAQSLFGIGRSDLERARLGNGNFSLHSVRPTLTLDFRDHLARPTRGILFSGTAEATRDLGAAETTPEGDVLRELTISTLKVAGTLTGYVPIAPRVVLAVSARGGKVFHLAEGSRTIATKRFFLGGASSMRGFGEDGMIPEDRRQALREEVGACRALVLAAGCTANANWLEGGNQVPSDGGELFTLVKSELRFPAFGSFDLGIFVEAGNLWADANNYDPLKLRYVAGTGIRYGTPIGPIAVDLGVNLLPDEILNERRANLHFSIGLF